MRLLSLTFRRFGPFEDRSLDLSKGNHGLNIILGRNEAGKTTALRGLGYFLFGFPQRTCDDYRFNPSDQRIGAKLVDSGGNELECYRRRGKLKTLRAGDEKTVILDEQFHACLGGLNAEQFRMLFGLNLDLLVQGGAEIARGHGGLGEALFSAGAGLAGLRRIDQQLAAKLDGLFKPRGHNQRIAETLRDWNEQRGRLRESLLRIETWKAQAAIMRDAVEKKRCLEDERRRGRTELDRLKTIRGAQPTIQLLREFEEKLQPLHSVKLLRADFASSFNKAKEQLLIVQSNAKAAREECQRLEEQIQPMELHAAVLAEEAAIERLARDLGGCLKGETDRPGLYARMREHQGNARIILEKNFGRQDLEEAAEQLKPLQADVDRIRKLGGQQQALVEAIETVKGRIHHIDDEIKALQDRRSTIEAPADVGELESLSASIAAEGPLEKQCRQAEEVLATNEQKALAMLKRLSICWDGPLEEVPGLPVPMSESVAIYQKQYADFEAAERDRTHRLEDCDKTSADYEKKIAKLLKAGPVPTETSLHEARSDRDNGFGLVRQEWLLNAANVAARDEFLKAHSPTGHLLDALRHGIDHCDDLSDRMLEEKDRSVNLSNHEAELRETEESRSQHAAKLEELVTQFADLKRRWNEEWRQAGVTPRSPGEMQNWLQSFMTLRTQAEDIRTCRQVICDRKKHIAECSTRLRLTLGLTDDVTRTLEQLLALTRQKIAFATAERKKIDQIEVDLINLRRDRTEEEHNLERAQDRYQGWRKEWAVAVGVIQLDADAEPATAYRYLDQITEMSRELRERDTLEMRINGIDRDREQYLAGLNALRERLDGPGLPPASAETMQTGVDSLQRRLKDARTIRTQQEELQKQLIERRGAAQRSEEQIRELDASLETLRQEAGVNRVEEIPSAIENSTTRANLEGRIEGERSRLRQLAAGRPWQEIINEADSEGANVDSRIQELDARLAPLDEEINRQVAAAQGAEQQLETWANASEEAAQIQQQMDSLLTRLRDEAEEFAVCHMARHVLRQTVERFRVKNQGTMLCRAEQYFATLTNEAFRGLDTDEDEEGQPVLYALRKQPDERVPVAGLSDGTRDQLFLSLRFAGIEQHLKKHGPMPLIVDDVLVNFDNERSLATLRSLCELSNETQVLFFTHHHHLLTMAEEHLPKHKVFIHHL